MFLIKTKNESNRRKGIDSIFNNKGAFFLDNQEKIAYLQRFIKTDLAFKRKLEKLDFLRTTQGKITHSFAPRVKGGSIYRNRDADIIAKIADLEIDIRDILSDLVDLRNEIGPVLDQIEDDRQCLLMHCRYIGCMTWVQVADKLEVSHQTVYKLHKQALEQININKESGVPCLLDKSKNS